VSLASKAVLGAIWSISTSVGGRALGLVGTLLLTRFLAPAEYGVVSVAIVLVSTVNVLSSPGFGQYVVANPNEGPDVVFHATLIHILVGWVILLGMLGVQEAIAGIFGMPTLVEYLPTLIAAVAVDRIGYLPNRVLARDMRFNVLGLRSLVSEVSYAVVAVYLAYKGWGPDAVMWAFVVRMVLGTMICAGAVELSSWFSPSRLRWATVRRMLDFGLPMTGANVMHFIAHKGDNLLIAGMFGPAAVGNYNFAYNIADIPATHVGEHIGDVLLPSFSKLDNPAAMHRALMRASGLLALVVFPLAVGLGAIAKTLVAVLLDPRWATVAPMLMILSGLSIFRPVGWLIQSYLQAVKRTRTLMILEGLKVGLILSLIYGLGQFGVLWACIAIGVAFGINAIASQWVIQRVDGVSFWALTKPYVRPLLACVPMAGAVLGFRHLIGAATWWSLILEIVIGAVAYVLSAFLIAGPQARDFLNLVGNVIRRRRGPKEDAAAAEPKPAEATESAQPEPAD
jgi:lipopolysaccharide exporter